MSKIRTFLKVKIINKFMACYYSFLGYHIAPSAKISTKAHLDKTNPKGVHIGENTVITPGVHILTHDYIRGDGTFLDTYIGNNVFIGINSIIMAGVKIADNIIVGSGSIVTKDFLESYCTFAGNPAKVIKRNVEILNPNYTTDGVHLNEDGYHIVNKHLQYHITY